ncbi:class I mannose-6-phosphate isomerase [Chimaeribacter arupi]|uniref:class I mannose-6-phosphate isomerase n=1 Tax=Chimaeribacter arupi TaxID=2060066 RepID=UPI000C7B3FCB|nr:class I mannose-6-phosphate isomerase [Chimaeribacter arupi]PLR45763.1 mannose-6-phosphate isomerase [Chimaeribacter arupi]
MKAYPLSLTLPLATHIFGGHNIRERLGKAGLPDGRIAETWEVSDVDGMIATVKNGELAGQTLRELTERYPDHLVAPGWRGPHFPLLTKFIDGNGMLPVHLHANDEAAARLEGQPNGKTEAWHILWAAEGATCLLGVKPGVDRATLRSALLDGDYDAVMYRYPVRAGDTFYVPGGMLHSFGPDTLIYEIEQTSNIQQHAMPWNMEDGSRLARATQEKNIDALLDELRPALVSLPHPGLLREETPACRRVICCAGPYFALERWRIASEYAYTFGSVRLVSNIGEPCELEANGERYPLGRAESLLLPAALKQVTFHGPGEVLVGYVPDLENDVRAPLRAQGCDDQTIRLLGDVWDERR